MVKVKPLCVSISFASLSLFVCNVEAQNVSPREANSGYNFEYLSPSMCVIDGNRLSRQANTVKSRKYECTSGIRLERACPHPLNLPTDSTNNNRDHTWLAEFNLSEQADIMTTRPYVEKLDENSEYPSFDTRPARLFLFEKNNQKVRRNATCGFLISRKDEKNFELKDDLIDVDDKPYPKVARYCDRFIERSVLTADPGNRIPKIDTPVVDKSGEVIVNHFARAYWQANKEIRASYKDRIPQDLVPYFSIGYRKDEAHFYATLEFSSEELENLRALPEKQRVFFTNDVLAHVKEIQDKFAKEFFQTETFISKRRAEFTSKKWTKMNRVGIRMILNELSFRDNFEDEIKDYLACSGLLTKYEPADPNKNVYLYRTLTLDDLKSTTPDAAPVVLCKKTGYPYFKDVCKLYGGNYSAGQKECSISVSWGANKHDPNLEAGWKTACGDLSEFKWRSDTSDPAHLKYECYATCDSTEASLPPEPTPTSAPPATQPAEPTPQPTIEPTNTLPVEPVPTKPEPGGIPTATIPVPANTPQATIAVGDEPVRPEPTVVQIFSLDQKIG